MASGSSGSSHLGVTDNQKRWAVAGIALNKILIPQIRPFLEQEVNKEYYNLKTSHTIHAQSTSGRLQRWPPRKFLKYENINGNDLHPRLPGGRPNYSLFDCQVTSHVDFARLYVENYMAKFNAFDDHCDASAVLSLLGGVPVFSVAVQAAAGDVRMARNDWAHCVFSKWDQTKFQQSFTEMEHLVRVMALPAADEGKILGELKDWETKGTQLCMNSPVDPALLQLVQQEVKSLQDDMDNMSVEFEEVKGKVQQELQFVAAILEEMKLRVQRLETGKQNLECRTSSVEERVTDIEETIIDFEGDANQRFEKLESLQQNTESRIGQVEDQVQNLEEKVDDLTIKTKEAVLSTASFQDSHVPAANPEELVEFIRRDYKGAALCPFPWCEDELQLELSNVFTRLQIVSRKKERSKLTDDTVNMTDVFRPHAECGKPRVVLIEGNPGMGKTTYCQKLAYDWSIGEIPSEALFPKVEMLLLLKCRDMNMTTANIEEAIEDQLLPQDVDRKKENFFHFIRSNQSRILLVLDGLDELRKDLFQGFLPLIQGKVFYNTYLILTARHEAGMKMRRYCDTLLEIVGYTHDDADSYIKKYFSNHEDQSLADKMIEKLKVDKQLRELTANPLNTALLCLLCEETRGVFPSKRTEMYDALVSCALKRFFAKKSVSFDDDDDPVEICADQLNQLGKVAFEALLKDQLYFSENEMKCQLTDFLQLCFLSRQPSVSKMRPTPCYAFTHKTFQEYFAAFYLAHQVSTGDKGMVSLLPQLSPVDNWQVWEFLLTMITSRSCEDAVFVLSRLCAFFYRKGPKTVINAISDTDAIFNGIRAVIKDIPKKWFRDQLAWSRDENTLNDVLTKTLHLVTECEDGAKELKDYQKRMVLVLAHCFPVKKLNLTPSSRYCSVYSEYLKANCTLSDLRLSSGLNELLLKTISHVFHPKHKLVRLNVENFVNSLLEVMMVTPPSQQSKAISDLKRRDLWFKDFGAEALTKVLHSGHLLTHLNLSKVSIFDEGVHALAKILQKNRALTHLNLCNASICDPGAITIAYYLQSNCTLSHLSLPQNWIGGLGVEALANALQRNRALKCLDLSNNHDGDSVAVALSEVVESNCALTHLDLSQSQSSKYGEKTMPFLDSDTINFIRVPVELIGPFGASTLARALQSNSTLTYLDLNFHRISHSGAAALGEALRSNCTLTQLYLNSNEISDSGAAALGEALRSNCTLTRLHLTENRIGASGADALGKALQSNRALTHLDLEGNLIGDSGAEALAKALQSNGTQLAHLDISYNKISSSGAIALAEALQFNRSLTCFGLDGNNIKSSGAAAFAKALQSNRTLTHLDLTKNDISDSAAIELAQALQDHNNTLIYLDLQDNPIGAVGAENLKRVDQSNCILKYNT